MHALTIITFSLASVGAVLAQTVECDAQNILDACKDQFEPRLKACTGNDWECYCQEATNLLQCYNNCPKTDASGVQNQKVSYCNAFEAQKPTSSKAAPSSTSTSTSGSSSGTDSTNKKNKPSGTGSEASASSSAAKSAGVVVTPARSFGAVAGFLAVAGVFL